MGWNEGFFAINGTTKDRWANENRSKEEKSPGEHGYCLHTHIYNQPEKSVDVPH